MIFNHLDEVNIRLYASGLVVMYKPHSFGKRSNDQLSLQAKQKRKFFINKSKVQSACVRAWQLKKTKNMLFLTYTFPFEPTEEEAAKIWDLTLKNLKQNYGINYYVWVKERQKNDRLHYHIIVDRNRIDIKSAQSSFNHHINNIRPDVAVSNNSLRLGNNPVIRSVSGVAKYLCKYISKGNIEFERRAYGFTTGMQLSKIIDTEEFLDLDLRYDIRQVLFEKFFEIYVIKCDFIELNLDNYDNST